MRSMRIRMFLSLWLVLALAAATAGLAQAQAASRLDQIVQRAVLRIGTTGDFKPFSFLNPATNEYEGHDIDAAKLLAESLGVKAQFVSTTWPTLLKEYVETGKVRWTFINFPLTQLHPNAAAAAEFAMCAAQGGAFWRIHDLLYLDLKDGREFYNPDKTWDADTLTMIAEVIAQHVPRPKQEDDHG